MPSFTIAKGPKWQECKELAGRSYYLSAKVNMTPIVGISVLQFYPGTII